MKTNRRFLLPLLALGAVLLATPLVVQASPGHGGFGGRHHGPHGDGMHGDRALHFMLRGLDLSEAQREQIHALMEQNEEAVSANREALGEAHRSLHELVLTESYDAARVKSVAETIGRLMGEMAENRAQLGNSIYKLLTPEQRQQLEERHDRRQAWREERRERRGR